MVDVKLDSGPEGAQPKFQERFEKLLEIGSDEILGKIKWQLGYTARVHGKEAFDPKKVGVQLDGLLRGDLTERLSSILSPAECRTVYSSSGIDMDNFKILSFYAITGEKTKEGILSYAVKKSLYEHPLAHFKYYLKETIKDEGKQNIILAEVNNEIVEGYSGKGKEDAGIFYGETVIPDEVLTGAKGEIAGLVEVKGYKPDEFRALVHRLLELKQDGAEVKPYAEVGLDVGGVARKMTLGVDLSKEIEFVDILRNVGFGLPNLDTDMPILLRLPADVSDADIISYGEILKGLHYKVTIQKLPLKSSEMEQRARKFVQKNLYLIQSGSTFSDREKKVLESYSQGNVTP